MRSHRDYNPRVLRMTRSRYSSENGNAVFDIGEANLRINRKPSTDLPAGLVCSEMTVGVGFGLYTVFFRRHS